MSIPAGYYYFRDVLPWPVPNERDMQLRIEDASEASYHRAFVSAHNYCLEGCMVSESGTCLCEGLAPR